MGNYKILAGLSSAILDSRNPCQYCLVSPQIKWQLLQIFEMVMVGISFLEGTSMTGNLIAILAYCNNMTSLLSLMQPWTISNGKEPPKDAFTVRSCYTLLEKPAPIPLWPWKTIWWSKASYKVKYHFDEIKEAYLTPNNFQLSNRCCLCKEKEETINHFFLHCKYNSQFWDMVFNILGIRWCSYPFWCTILQQPQIFLKK
ncbi:hypothetical protein KY290_022016 [Solanum tuberosum]|uniref:Reverse transcriptase zinc-binding domain-containing protein n=1 Tax=Solanum tuberosum TaxID=4113 RepID=A0ABQ7V367_SOLTU|nr:hypothetical protein KY289_021168 [Solanum tuberosum]KAH0758523.1 hypothetical protein KY290_022016 [Solanum tuberosum]